MDVKDRELLTDIVNRLEAIEDYVGLTERREFNNKIKAANEYLKTVELKTRRGDIVIFDYLSSDGMINGYLDHISTFWNLNGEHKNGHSFFYGNKNDLINLAELQKAGIIVKGDKR